MNKYSRIITGKIKPMSDTDRDPRPDLKEDHMDWASVLITAHKMDNSRQLHGTEGGIFGLLHGLRCGGARLENVGGDIGAKRLKLDYKPLLKENGGVWDKDELVNKWLIPLKSEMAQVFRRAVA